MSYPGGRRAVWADLVVAVVLAISLTGMWYVRRTVLPRLDTLVAAEDLKGSRDRRLHGKARIGARRRP